MIEKNKESQSQSLTELQQELKSLKALLLSRGSSYPPSPSPSLPTFVGRPSIPAWQLAGSSHATSHEANTGTLSTATATPSILSPSVNGASDSVSPGSAESQSSSSSTTSSTTVTI